MMKQNKRLVAFTVAVITILIVSSILPASAQLSQWRSLNPTRDGTIPPLVFGQDLGPTLYSVQLFGPSVGWAVGGTCNIYPLTFPVSCPSPDRGFALHWDGSRWRQTLLPTSTHTLTSVFTVGANDAWAVGMDRTIIHWDGISWVSVPVPTITTMDLYSVFILPGGLDGWAVGSGTANILRWSGTWPTGAWSVFSPNPPASFSKVLRGVFLSSPTQGWAVGLSADTPARGTIFRWDGAGWTDISATSPTPNNLYSVFIVSPMDAWAVGAHDAGTLQSTIIRWNGASWTGPMVAPTSSVDYHCITMVSGSDGWIAGEINPTSQEGTLLRWNGAAWNPVRSWVTVDLNSLFMLPGGSTGLAVGNAETIIRWNGSIWLAQTSPTSTNLNAISMVASDSGWAVGDHGRILSYDGTSWSHYETLPSGVSLYGLHMRTSSDGWAVGAAPSPVTSPSGGFPPTILHWNGAAWTAITPSGVALGQTLYAVDMLTATESWAAGDGIPPTAAAAVMLKWDGTIWMSVPSGTPVGARLYSIDMLSSTDGWAVGCATPPTYASPVIVRWNGLAWSQITAPSGIAGLYDVFMLSPTDGWAVGNATLGQATIVHWDGTQWRRVPGPATGTAGFLRSIHMVSPTDGWAIGQVDMVSAPDGTTGPRSLIVHWDGLTWDVVATPPLPPTMSVALQSVFMVNALDGWMVSNQGLILHYGPEVVPGTTTSTTTSTSTVIVTSTSTSSTTNSTSTSTTATTPPLGSWGIPGFPIESILAGLVAGVAVLAVLRHRPRRRS